MDTVLIYTGVELTEREKPGEPMDNKQSTNVDMSSLKRRSTKNVDDTTNDICIHVPHVGTAHFTAHSCDNYAFYSEMPKSLLNTGENESRELSAVETQLKTEIFQTACFESLIITERSGKEGYDKELSTVSEDSLASVSCCSYYCCRCCRYKVAPESVDDVENKMHQKANVIEIMQCYPDQKGWNLFFADRERRIDYVLVYKEDEGEEHLARVNMRATFERNLEEEGLELERDIKEGRNAQFTLIHAPWEVLVRYAEVMKIRLPMKEVPEELQSESVWEVVSDYFSKLLSPFELDPEKVPPLTKKFTCIFERKKEYLFDIPPRKHLLFSNATRSRIVDYILRRKSFTDDVANVFAFGIPRLIAEDCYVAAYPLHEGNWKSTSTVNIRKLLREYWANWKMFYKVQPLDYIRTYYGEKIGLYFAWLGYYTYFLIPASIVGLIVFIYGIATVNADIVARESCDFSNMFMMCPLCDQPKVCSYWNYASQCLYARASHMFDNGATVFFAIFMSLWGTFFLEFWKREEAGIKWRWNLTNFEDEEEPPRPEYLVRLSTSRFMKTHKVTKAQEPYLPFWRRQVPVYLCSVSVMMFLVFVALAAVVGVILYRMAVLAALYSRDEELVYKNAGLVTSATAACINLIFIFILNFLYGHVSVKLTDWECLRTQSDYDNSLTFKLYVLQFVNYYSSIFYIAFIKGKTVGRPGDYNTFFGARQEECPGGSCLMELCVQLAIIFVGKQFFSQLVEVFLPRLQRCVSSRSWASDIAEDGKSTAWEKDYRLHGLGSRGLFDEYLEMLLQFGFVTIFVAAFPLAPFFALLNNVIEIRADADKFVTILRRPMAARAESIGIWYRLLYGVSRIAILSNAFIIAFTSNFIDRFVYLLEFSGDRSYYGFVNYSLSYFNVSDFALENRPDSTNISLCRYRDYREPPWEANKYEYTIHFWHVMAGQFIFVVVFENVVILLTCLIAFLVPDVPAKLDEQIRRENYLTNEIILKTELEVAKGRSAGLNEEELDEIRNRTRTDFRSGSVLKTVATNAAQKRTPHSEQPTNDRNVAV